MQKKKASKVTESCLSKFEYLGYSDTIVALIYGNVLSPDSLSTDGEPLRPLSDVTILVEQNNQKVLTDDKGNFCIGLQKGVFSLLVSKAGYQGLRIKNYISDPDQVSDASIILVEGNGIKEASIPQKPHARIKQYRDARENKLADLILK